MYQHPGDWHNATGIIRQADDQGMGIILMRPLTSGVFQRLMAEAWAAGSAATRSGAPRSTPSLATVGVGRLLLNYVLSDPHVDVALVRGRVPRGALTRLGEPRFVKLNNEISDDVASRIDLAQLHDRYVRSGE